MLRPLILSARSAFRPSVQGTGFRPGPQMLISTQIPARAFSNFKKPPSILDALRQRTAKAWAEPHLIKGSRFLQLGRETLHEGESPKISWQRLGATAVGIPSRLYL